MDCSEIRDETFLLQYHGYIIKRLMNGRGYEIESAQLSIGAQKIRKLFHSKWIGKLSKDKVKQEKY